MRHLSGWVEKLLFKSHCLEVKSPPSLSPNGEQHDRFSASQLRVCSHYFSYAISYRHMRRRPPLPSPLQWAARSGSAHIQLLWRSLICDITCKKIASPWSQEREPVCLTLMHADKHNDTHIHTLRNHISNLHEGGPQQTSKGGCRLKDEWIYYYNYNYYIKKTFMRKINWNSYSFYWITYSYSNFL